MPSLPSECFDPLVMADGSPVRDADDWQQRRAPELRERFQDEVYGRLPEPVPVRWELEAEAHDLFDGAVHYRGLRVDLILPEGQPHPLHVALFTPRGSAPPPVFVATSRSGNPSLVDHPAIVGGAATISPHSSEPQSFGRGEMAKAWPIETICRRGYALATFGSNDAEPDHPAATGGLRQRLGSGDDRHWGALACWAWASMRVLDALADCQFVDAGRAAITGMSRRGKASLIAGAFDPRFKLVIPHQSGTGGMALSRQQPAESVARITEVFPHWFGPRFAGYAEQPEALPLDQHQLIALCAPRAVLGLAGDQDTWASPALADEALRLAAPVWRLLGADSRVGIYRDAVPEGPLPRLMQFWRDTGHQVDAVFWEAYLAAADQHLR